MPSKKPRVNLTLPEDLMQLVSKDAASLRIGEATRVMQIVDEHYKRMAMELKRTGQVLRGSQLLAGQSETTLDFSGGLSEDQAQSDEQSKGGAST